MSGNKLTNDTIKKLDDIVERLARKAGYTVGGELTHKQFLHMKLRQVRKSLYDNTIKKTREPSESDFAEEIKACLSDTVNKLISQGHSEEEAIRITMEKFDEAELKHDFEGIMEEFSDFGISSQPAWDAKNSEAIGMYYAAFMTLGMSLGAFIGFHTGHTLVSAGIGVAAGLCVGTGLGLLAHALLAAYSQRTLK